MERLARQDMEDGCEVHLVRYAPGDLQPPHAHDRPSLSLVLAGSVREEVGSEVVAGRALHCVVKPAGMVHANAFGREGALMIQILPAPDRVEEVRDAGCDLDRWVWSDGVALQPWLRLTHALLGEAGEDQESLAMEALESVSGLPRRSGKAPAWLWSVRERLREETDARLGDLATEHGVHRVHLTRAFRQHFGMSPSAFRARARAADAVRLLMAGQREGRALADIALAAGYADQPHMTRELRRWLGMTPVSYRACMDRVRTHGVRANHIPAEMDGARTLKRSTPEATRRHRATRSTDRPGSIPGP